MKRTLETEIPQSPRFAVQRLVGDTRYHAACTIHDETGFLVNAASDIVGAPRNAGERQAEDDADPAAWTRRYYAETAR